jgi:hypothetical protein
MKLKLFVLLMAITILVAPLFSITVEYSWDDIKHFPMPISGYDWKKGDEVNKARYLDLYYCAVQYLTANIGRPTKDLDLSIAGPSVAGFPRVTLEVISMYYRFYGDLPKAAETLSKFWTDSRGNPDFAYPDEDPLSSVIFSFEEAGMYKEALPFYEKRYQERLETIKVQSDIILFQKDFNKYKEQYPDLAEGYSSFMKAWNNAKKLAKTNKPKPLDPAVQHHEWFYSDKIAEVVKALAYYKTHKVKFMIEKAAKDKRPAIAKKAKEYLDNWDTVSATR